MVNNNVILVTGSYEHNLIFWDATSGTMMNTIEYNEKVKKLII